MCSISKLIQTKSYYYFDAKNQLQEKKLNAGKRFLRCLGFYSETHLKKVLDVAYDRILSGSATAAKEDAARYAKLFAKADCPKFKTYYYKPKTSATLEIRFNSADRSSLNSVEFLVKQPGRRIEILLKRSGDSLVVVSPNLYEISLKDMDIEAEALERLRAALLKLPVTKLSRETTALATQLFLKILGDTTKPLTFTLFDKGYVEPQKQMKGFKSKELCDAQRKIMAELGWHGTQAFVEPEMVLASKTTTTTYKLQRIYGAEQQRTKEFDDSQFKLSLDDVLPHLQELP
ncbi:MAG: hypothetical protein H0X51_06390 [Parachlamydiaceae bacterium]|nr:hypothetical protein [Parachlamydiaceae bacterium]